MNTNKKILLSVLFLVLLAIPCITVLAFNETIDQPIGEHFCSQKGVNNAFRFLGYLVLWARVIVPFAIIIMGSIDLFKTVVADQSDELKKQVITLGKRILAGLLIFFIPTFINMIFALFDNFNSDEKADYRNCVDCVLEPWNCEMMD